MPNYTFPNQRKIVVHRETARADFLGIKNVNWQSAARDLGAHALMLYLYLASNANNYELALSPQAIQNAIGMPRSTYHDQFAKLISKGYIVPNGGNKYDFFEVPQTRDVNKAIPQNPETSTELNFADHPSAVKRCTSTVRTIPAEDIQINNIEIPINNDEINNDDFLEKNGIYVPKVKKVVIPVPKLEGKKNLFKPEKKEFVF